jgi:hypothetical protein
LVALVLGCAAVSARAQGAWYPLGTGQSPVNHSSTTNAEAPTLASVNGNTTTGALYLAWQEAASIQNAGTVDQIRAALLAQDPFEPRPWNELLSAGAFSLNLDPAHEARDPSVAVIGGVPYVAWIENDGSADQVRVAKWDGSAWDPVGDPNTPINSADPGQVSLADNGGTPYIAWTELCCGDPNDGHSLYVDSFNGTSWVSVGSGPLNYYPGGDAQDPQLAPPYVTWAESGSIHVSQFDGTNWNLLGAGGYPISDSGATAAHPSFTEVGNQPYVAWDQAAAGGTSQVFVSQWEANTSTWSRVGAGSLNRHANEPAQTPSLTDIRGTPYIAWTEQASGGSNFLLQTSYFDGTEWLSLGPPVNQDASDSARAPDLIDAYTYNDSGPGFTDTPVLAWSETDSAGHDQIRVAAYGQAPKNLRPPRISGTPQNGHQLSCTDGNWTGSPTTFTVVWDRGLHSATSPNDPSWHAIDGATGNTYTVTAADDGSRIRCRVIASTQIVSGEAVSASLRADAGVPYDDAPDGQPFITGTPIARDVLTCHPGTISTGPGVPGWHNNPSFAYQWTRNGVNIPGSVAKLATYRLTRYRAANGSVTNPVGDGDHNIGCRVTGSNDVGSSAPIAAPPVHAVDGVPIDHNVPIVTVTRDDPTNPDPLKETLACSPGTWYEDYGEFQYQWLRNGAPIAGATATSYRPVEDDYGRKISCQVTDGNPAGRSRPAVSGTILVALPQGVNDIDFHREGGTNPVDPTNLLAITGRYEKALRDEVISKLKDGITQATNQCQGEIASNNWPHRVSKRLTRPLTEEERCQILVYDPQDVTPLVNGGVVYTGRGACPGLPTTCPSLSIEVKPIDPMAPPREPTGLLAEVAAATPVKIIWDLDNNGTTDGVCPASAPVMRSILDYHRDWNVGVTIIDEDGTVHTGHLNFPLGDDITGGGELRPDQVNVCATSFDPPPSPQLPCVTGGQIGSIHITNANLCPISARDIQDADFEQLLSGDLQQYLLRVSEQQLLNEGAATSSARRGDGGQAKPVYVGWDSPPTPGAAADTSSASSTLRVGSLTVQKSAIAGGLADTIASLASENSPAGYIKFKLTPSLITGGKSQAHPDWLKFAYDGDNAPFAYDQIYVARGEKPVSGAADVGHAGSDLTGVIPTFSGDDGSMMVNGVDMTALPDAAGPTAELLVPSDVSQALPNVNSMTLVGRNVATSLGLPTDPQATILSLKGELKQQFNDAVNTAQDQVIQTANVDALEGQANALASQGQALAQQQLDDLLATIKRQLNLGPFNLAGDVTVDANNDGTATIHASAALPGLSGVDGQSLRVAVTINADLQGHLHLAGIHLHADEAFLFGINLSDLDLTYDGNGLDVKGEMLFPQLANAGIKINDFKLAPDGSIQRLDLAYEAGAGQGIPLGYGLYLTALGALVDLQSSTFAAHATFSVGPSVGGGCPPVGMDTTLQVRMSHPFSMDGDGDAVVACVPIGHAHFHADEGGNISLSASAGLDVGPIHVHGDIGAAFQCTKDCTGFPLYQVWMDATGAIDPIIKNAGVHVVLSNQGLAGCGEIDVDIPIVDSLIKLITGHRTIHLAAGAAENFVDNRPPLSFPELVANLSLFTGCDIGRYYVLPHVTQAVDAAAGSASFRIAPGTGPVLLSLEGAGRAPLVSLRTPSGQTLDFTHATANGGKRLAGGEWGIVLPTEDRTVVILPRPQSGVWTAAVASGSTRIVRIRQAAILPPVAFRASGSGHGASRVLKYLIASEKGQTVRFYEIAKGENKLLRTIRGGGRGQIHYTSGLALSTHRQVLAEVFGNGQLRAHRIVATYNAPNPRLGKVRHLRVRRRGGHAVITWGRTPLASSYLVEVSYGTGQRLLFKPRPGRRRLVVNHVRRGEGLTVKVIAFTSTGTRGPLTRVQLKGTMLVGAAHTVPPFKPPHRRRRHRHHH